MDLATVPTNQLREAAAAWRRHDAQTSMHREASGIFKWFIPEPNTSIYDRIDELVDEIDRLRRAS